jgi:hypothetical protein
MVTNTSAAAVSWVWPYHDYSRALAPVDGNAQYSQSHVVLLVQPGSPILAAVSLHGEQYHITPPLTCVTLPFRSGTPGPSIRAGASALDVNCRVTAVPYLHPGQSVHALV